MVNTNSQAPFLTSHREGKHQFTGTLEIKAQFDWFGCAVNFKCFIIARVTHSALKYALPLLLNCNTPLLAADFAVLLLQQV